MTPDQAAALLDATVSLLGALACADVARARLPGNSVVVERALVAVHRVEGGFMPPTLRDMAARAAARQRALVGGDPALHTLLTDVRAFVADELAWRTASHARDDGAISPEGEATVSAAAALLARLDAALAG